MGAYWWLNHDIFRFGLLSSPVVVVLVISLCSSTCGPPGPPNCQKLGICVVIMFLNYWTVYKTYGAQCRSAWAMVMLSDEDFRSNATKVEETVHEYLRDDFAVTENDHADESIESMLEAGAKLAQAAHVPNAPTVAGTADTSNSSAVSSPNSSKSSNSSREFELVVEQWGPDRQPAAPQPPTAPLGGPAEMDGKAAVEAAVKDAGEEWFKPWSNGDSMNNLLLRAYCLHHRRDASMPHVYPLTKFGIGGHEINFKLPCTFGTCVLTESRESGTGKLVYVVVLVGIGIAQWVHGRVTGPPTSAWWQWLWACILPLWGVALVQSTSELASFELPELVGYLIQSARDMIVHPFTGEWETSTQLTEGEKAAAIEMRDRDTDHIVFVAFLILAVIAFCFRQRIGDACGLHDWLPRFSLLGGSDRHEFQVFIWKVEPSGVPADDVRDSSADGGTSWRGWLLGGVSGPGGCMMSPRAISQNTLPFELAVHLIYAGDELQHSQKARPTEQDWMAPSVYYIRECFKLSLEHGQISDFVVEMRGRAGADFFRSTVTISPEMLGQEFRRSNEALSQRIDVEQFGAMNSLRNDEDKMRGLGFRGYRGTNGGEVWLAFCDS